MDDDQIPAGDPDLEALLRRESRGIPPPWESTPWDFVYRWPSSVLRERLWPIVSRFLIDQDDAIRARAVEFVRIWTDGQSLTTPRLLEVSARHAELYADQQVDGITLRHSLAWALSNLAYQVGEPAVRILREMNERAPEAGSVIGRYYPDYAIERAPQFGDAHADWIEEAARTIALYRRDFVVAFLGALRRLSAETRERALAAVEEGIERDDAKAAATAQGEGFPPPAQPAPSGEDCRLILAEASAREADQPPAERVRELERLLERIRTAESGQLNYEAWERWGSSNASPKECAAKEAELAGATRERDEARAALDALVATIRIGTPAERAAWAEALAAIGGPVGMGLVGELLKLPRIDREIVIPALQRTLDDASSEVRTSAWEGIIKAFDLGPHFQNPEGKRDLSTELELWRILLGRELAAFSKMGGDKMRGLVERLRAGASPESLGIAWKASPEPELFDQLRSTLFEADQPFPVDDLARLTGADRRWAEAMIAFRLEQKDPRAPEALARLGATWTAPALEEIGRAATTPPELRKKINWSLRALDGPSKTVPSAGA